MMHDPVISPMAWICLIGFITLVAIGVILAIKTRHR